MNLPQQPEPTGCLTRRALDRGTPEMENVYFSPVAVCVHVCGRAESRQTGLGSNSGGTEA